MTSTAGDEQPHTSRRRLWPVVLLVALVAVAGFLLLLRRAVRATNRDAWAFSVIDVVSAAALDYAQKRRASPESLEGLIADGFLLVGKRGEFTTLRTPAFAGACGGIDSLSNIRLHLPESIEGWRIVGDSVVDEDGKQTGLPFVEIVGEDYLPDGLAQRANRRFARNWFEAMRGNRLDD